MGHPVNEDQFRLVVGGSEVPIISAYSVHAGVFEVPATFDMTVGHSGLMVDLLHGFAEFTPFELYVNDVRVMVGEIDELSGTSGNKTELKVTGFDRLARLTTTKIDSERSFSEETFASLTEKALAEVGLADVSLYSSNLANRKAITGSVRSVAGPTIESQQTPGQPPAQGFRVVNGQLVPLPPPPTTPNSSAPTVAAKRAQVVLNSLTMESGTTWWDFLIAQYARGGLFLWADVFGSFVLATPDGKQAPLYRLVRRRGVNGEPGEVTFLGQPDFRRSTRNRYSEIRVQGRKGTGPNGRGQVEGVVYDEEMIALLNPEPADRANGGKRKKINVYPDPKCKTNAQAKFLALRKMAQSRRDGCSLSYTVSGHTVNAISGGGRLVWQPDTVVQVFDEDLGIDEPYYLDSCSYSRGPKSMTRLNLMRCEDLLFGEEDLETPPPVRKAGLPKVVRMGKTEVFRPKWTKNPNWGGLPTLSDPNGFDSDRIITPDGIVDASGNPRL